MTEHAHLSLDDLADWRAGLTDETRAADIASEVGSCSECAEAAAALDRVDALLAAEAATTLQMPADVLDSIDLALDRTALEVAADVPSLTDRRTSTESTQPAGRRRMGAIAKAVGAAAAVVVIGGIGFHLVTGSTTSNSASDSAGDSAGGSTSMGEKGGQPTAQGPRTHLPEALAGVKRLNKSNVASYAAAAESTASDATTKRSEVFLGPCRRVATPAPVAQLAVKWEGRDALLLLDSNARRASIYPCHGVQQRLYSTRY